MRFDRFEIDSRQRVLLRDGEIVRLTPKAFDLLELLVSRPDEVVPKSELVERVWPDTFVSDANLSKLVFRSRTRHAPAPAGVSARDRTALTLRPRRAHRRRDRAA